MKFIHPSGTSTSPEQQRIKTEPINTPQNTINSLPNSIIPLGWQGLITSVQPQAPPPTTTKPPTNSNNNPRPPPVPRPPTAQTQASPSTNRPAPLNLTLGKRKNPEESEDMKLRAPPPTATKVLEYVITAEMNKPKLYMKRPFTVQFLSGALGLSDRKTDPLT